MPSRAGRLPFALSSRRAPMPALSLCPTTERDLDAVVAAERCPDAAPFVEVWPRARHARALSDPDIAHLTLVTEGRRVGFAILAGLAEPRRAVELRRIVVAERGQGFGRAALREIVTLAFGRLGARRLWLDVKPSNTRARALYLSEGFVEEDAGVGVHAQPGAPGALIVMAKLATDVDACDASP